MLSFYFTVAVNFFDVCCAVNHPVLIDTPEISFYIISFLSMGHGYKASITSMAMMLHEENNLKYFFRLEEHMDKFHKTDHK